MKTFKRYIANEYFQVCMVLVLSMVLRIVYLYFTTPAELIYDSASYDAMARQFLDKGFLGYASSSPNAYITPGYPLFLALIYKVFGYKDGSPLMTVRFIQIILSTATVFLLYHIARKVAGRRAALLAAVFSSVYLISIWAPTLILTEVLYTFLFILYLYIQINALSKKSVAIHFVTGIFLALAVLVRPLIAPLIALPYVYFYYKERDKFYIRAFLFNAAGFVLVMLPWWIRNLVVMDKFIPFATQADPLLRGTYPYDVGVENIPLENQKEEAIKRLIEGFTKQPLLYLKWYTIGKFDYLFFKIYYYVDDRITLFRQLLPLHYLYVWFGWVGAAFVFYSKKISRFVKLLTMYLVLTTAANLVFVATSRYSYPLMPILMLLSAIVIDFLFQKEKASATDKCG